MLSDGIECPPDAPLFLDSAEKEIGRVRRPRGNLAFALLRLDNWKNSQGQILWARPPSTVGIPVKAFIPAWWPNVFEKL